MIRFFIIFGLVFALTLSLLASVASQYNYSLMDGRMSSIWLVSILVATYVAWRINGILKKRENSLEKSGQITGAQKGKLGALFTPRKSSAQLAREARVASRRKRLIADGKLKPDPVIDTPDADPEVQPTRVSRTASIEDRMAARRERVRLAKERGDLPDDDG